MIFEQQNQKKFAENFFSEKQFGKKNFEKKKKKREKILKIFFQLQVTIPSAHPVQISCRSDYCITLS